MVMKGSTRYWNYFEVYCPCAGGLSAVNAIGTQMCDPINSGLIRWRMAVLNKQKDAAAEVGRNTRFSLSMYGDEQADGRTLDGTTIKILITAEPVSRGQILRRERGQEIIHFPCSADHGQDWQHYPVGPSLKRAIHTFYSTPSIY